MKAADFSPSSCAIAQSGMNDEIPLPPRSRRHDMLYVTYLRACGGSTREDLCQILIQDIHEALRLQSRPLAADLLVVLGMIVSEYEKQPIEEILAVQTGRAAAQLGGKKAA